MEKISKEERRRLQKLADQEKCRNNYSFNLTVDEFGQLHVDCDAETFIRETGLITMEEHIKRLNNIQLKYYKADNLSDESK